MDSVLAYVQAHQRELVRLLREMVRCESPSDDPRAVNRFNGLLADSIRGMARIRTVPGGARGKHLLCEFRLGKTRKEGQILALGHSDTVWPLGTLKQMPWREEQGRLWGPGVLDMKAGLAFFIYAMRALRDLDVPVRRKVVLQVNSDEETGSHSSRALTEAQARSSAAVLVLEPGTGLEGRLKTARKGVGGYRLTVHGKSSHAGVDFAAGVNAIVELAHQVRRIESFTNMRRGVTINVGVFNGGTRSNVVPAVATAEIDYRIPRMSDYDTIRCKFKTLVPANSLCRLELTGELNRPPMERTAGVVQLFRLARKLAKNLGVALQESSTGGGSDGNFTAALGVPTLDGLGGVGEGAHALHESILVDRIADRTALLARLVEAL